MNASPTLSWRWTAGVTAAGNPVDISRGLEQCAGTFRLSVTDRWPQQNEPRGIKAGAACRVTIDGRAVITGYVDDVEASWSATSHEYRVSGRDKTADSGAILPPALPAAQGRGPARAGPPLGLGLFGIEVTVEAECNKAVPGFKTEEGETCFEMLERLARANAVMLTSDGDGRLVITRAGTHKAAAALQMGGNLLRLAFAPLSMKDPLFGSYCQRPVRRFRYLGRPRQCPGQGDGHRLPTCPATAP